MRRSTAISSRVMRGSDVKENIFVNNDLCELYERIIRQELGCLFTQCSFEFVDCKVVKSGERCHVALSSPYVKLWIDFEMGIPTAMVGHPNASFDNAYLSTDDPHWYGLNELVSYFAASPVDKLLHPSNVRDSLNEVERATNTLRDMSTDWKAHCEQILCFFRDDQFEKQSSELRLWRMKRWKEFERLLNEQERPVSGDQ